MGGGYEKLAGFQIAFKTADRLLWPIDPIIKKQRSTHSVTEEMVGSVCTY